MFFIELQLEVGAEEHYVIFLHVWGVLHAELENAYVVWVELEEDCEEVAKLFIVANPASPHL